MHRLTVFLLLVLSSFCALVATAPELQAAPLLQEGKRTLYQRVISHPSAVLHAEASEQSQVVCSHHNGGTLPAYFFQQFHDVPSCFCV